jgi:magnesium transporter
MRDPAEHQQHLEDILAQVQELLRRKEVVETLTSKQETRRRELVRALVEKQQRAMLEHKINRLHPADIAYLLESLPLDERGQVWELVQPQHHGAVLLEVSDAARASLIADMDREEILDITEHLESDEIADLAPDLPDGIMPELLDSLDSQDRAQVQTVLGFPEDSVGALMNFDMITVRDDVDLEVVLRYLRRRGALPLHIHSLIVTNRQGVLRGVLPLRELLLHPPETPVTEVMNREPMFFYTDDDARDAASAFERYDLLSAPVLNVHQQLVGVLNVDAVMDFIQESAQKEILNQAGLAEEEDLFAPVWKSGKNRWPWLALNLMTALLASRVIGVFEHTIEQLVALAALMPIVSGIGGNTGTQTMTLIVRGLALKQITPDNFGHLLYKELSIAAINGLLWGGVMGFVAYMLYNNARLGLVMAAAMVLNLLVAALAGVFIPWLLQKRGRDPAMGASVMLTALTDSMGFFIFLGLATLVLMGQA